MCIVPLPSPLAHGKMTTRFPSAEPHHRKRSVALWLDLEILYSPNHIYQFPGFLMSSCEPFRTISEVQDIIFFCGPLLCGHGRNYGHLAAPYLKLSSSSFYISGR